MLEATGSSGAQHGSRNREVLVDGGADPLAGGAVGGGQKMAPTGGA